MTEEQRSRFFCNSIEDAGNWNRWGHAGLPSISMPSLFYGNVSVSTGVSGSTRQRMMRALIGLLGANLLRTVFQ